ncbi:MAG TPA: SulP family inorganic anion transporter [Burkholderiales bacterium]|nr:SulP family inorganic anion transporter [Burkholderiales bacterium]
MSLSRFMPSLVWLRHYPLGWVRPDLIAGLTAGAIVIPKAMAYATIAGLPLQVGLYTAIVPMLVYALFGASRVLSVSTTTTIAILAAAELGRVVPSGDPNALLIAAATLAVLTGAMLFVASCLRLGFVANFISEPVLTGFKSGIGLVIVVDQIPKLLGVHIEKTGFFRDIYAIVQALPAASIATFTLATLLLLLIFMLERFTPKLPIPLIAIGLSILASAWGLSEMGVAVVGSVPADLPGFVPPDLALLEEMWPAAAGIALMSFTETIAAARAFAAPGESRPEPNQELLAIGLANVAGGLTGAMPAGGGTSQTALNSRVGARTQVAALTTAGTAVATLIVLAPLIALMPQAALAVVVIAYSLELIRPGEFLAIRRVRRIEFRWALIAFVGVILLGTLKGILIAVFASLFSLAQQAYNPPIYVVGRKRGTTLFRPSKNHPENETWPGLLIMRMEGRLFFANAQQVTEVMQSLIAEAKPKVALLDCSAVIDIEFTAIKMLGEMEENLRKEGVALWLAALNASALDVLRHSGLGEVLGRDRVFSNLDSAVARFTVERT